MTKRKERKTKSKKIKKQQQKQPALNTYNKILILEIKC